MLCCSCVMLVDMKTEFQNMRDSVFELSQTSRGSE